MDQPLAYLGDRFVPHSAALIPCTDAGFMLGATVSEQLRTFRGRLFRLDDHLRRLAGSLEVVGVEAPLPLATLGEKAQELVDHNFRLLDPADDLGLSVFITPGPYATLAPQADPQPLLGMHTYPLPFSLWADAYQRGVALATVEIEQVSPRCWPAALKCRSRMHYYLADRQARQRHSGARALLLHADGTVSETATSNILTGNAQGSSLVSPPRERILPGVSLGAVEHLAESLGVQWTQRDLVAADVADAAEVLLTSTPSCLLPVTRFNGRPIGNGLPGAMQRRLLACWSDLVGVDIAAQAERFAHRAG